MSQQLAKEAFKVRCKKKIIMKAGFKKKEISTDAVGSAQRFSQWWFPMNMHRQVCFNITANVTPPHVKEWP